MRLGILCTTSTAQPHCSASSTHWGKLTRPWFSFESPEYSTITRGGASASAVTSSSSACSTVSAMLACSASSTIASLPPRPAPSPSTSMYTSG